MQTPFVFMAVVAFALLFGLSVGLALRLRQASMRVAHLHAAKSRAMRDAFYRTSMMDASHDGLVLQRLNGAIIWANTAYCQMQGFGLEEIVGRNPLEFCIPDALRPGPEEIANFRYVPPAAIGEGEEAGIHLRRNQRKNGELFWNQISVSFLTAPDGEQTAVLVCRDVTEQVEREEMLRETSRELEHIVAHDSLTQAANRAALMSRLAEHFGSTDRRPTGLVNIDIDHFKQVNDTHGHAAGDALLCHVATALRAVARPGELVSRIGGDEFIIVLDGQSTIDDVSQRASAFHLAPGTCVHWQDRSIPFSISAGAAIVDPATEDATTLMAQADYALYQSKRSGRGRLAVYDSKMTERHQNANRLIRHLRHEIADDSLRFHFQPLVSIENGKVEGFETLVRLHHPIDGLIAPGRFLHLAAENGLMRELDLAAMRAALKLGRDARDRGHDGLRISFNASPEILGDPDFPATLRDEAARHTLGPENVVIEVLETVVLGQGVEDSPAMRTIRELHAAGFRVVLDDFGTGFAGLSHLANLPLSGIKIDQSLVRRLLTDETSRKIVASIADLCSDLHLATVAEGVEDRETAIALSRMNCSIVQGFWIAPALPSKDALSLIDRHDPTAFRTIDHPEGPDVIPLAPRRLHWSP